MKLIKKIYILIFVLSRMRLYLILFRQWLLIEELWVLDVLVLKVEIFNAGFLVVILLIRSLRSDYHFIRVLILSLGCYSGVMRIVPTDYMVHIGFLFR